MNFSLSDEQKLLSSELARYLGDHQPVETTRAELGSEPDRDSWLGLARDLGLAALYVPPDFGGTGTGAVEVAVAMQEFGAALYPGPFLASSVLSTRALVHCGAKDLLGRLEQGEVATLAYAEGTDASMPAVPATLALGSSEVEVVGVKERVLAAGQADVLLVVATSESKSDQPVLVAVEAGAPGVLIEPIPSLDPTRPASRITFDQAPGTIVTRSARGPLADAFDQAGIALASEIVGAAARCLEMTVEYVCDRVQFGRSVGSFQAVKHRCADALVELEAARSGALVAAFYTADHASLPRGRAAALSLAGEVGCTVAKSAVQLHGGIGFTWEADVHLYLRRLRSSAYLFGAPASHRSQLWSLASSAAGVAP